MALLQGGTTASLWLLGAPPLKEKLWNRIAPLPRPLHAAQGASLPPLGWGRARPPAVPPPPREVPGAPAPGEREGELPTGNFAEGLGGGWWRCGGSETDTPQPRRAARGAGSRQSLPGATRSGRHMEERRGVAGPGCGATGTSRRGGGGTGREGGSPAERRAGRGGGGGAPRRAAPRAPRPRGEGSGNGGREGRGIRRGPPSGARRRSGRGSAAARLTMSTLAAFSSWAITSGAPPAAAAAAAIMVSLQ